MPMAAKARATQDPDPAPDLASFDPGLVANQFVHLGPDRFDVHFQDVAAAIATVAREGDERRLDDQLVDLGIAPRGWQAPSM